MRVVDGRTPASGDHDETLTAINVTVHAAETPVEKLTGDYLPLLLRTAADISHDSALLPSVPGKTVRPAGSPVLRR